MGPEAGLEARKGWLHIDQAHAKRQEDQWERCKSEVEEPEKSRLLEVPEQMAGAVEGVLAQVV